MILRAITLVSVLGMLFFTGCTCQTYGHEPPRLKFCNVPRLVDECAWFYADIQDLVFGVDYYQDLNDQFGGSPYN